MANVLLVEDDNDVLPVFKSVGKEWI